MAVDINKLSEDDIFDLSDEEFDEAYREASRASGSEDQDVTDTDVEDTQSDDEENIDDGEPSDDDLNNEPTDDGSVDEVDEENQETQEGDEGQLDGDPEPQDGDTNDNTSETPVIDLKPVKIDGVDVPVQSIDELYALASAGGKFTQKMQEISKYKKSILMLEEQNLSEKDLSLLAEIKNGNKDALAALIAETGVNPMDISATPSEGYAPGAYIPSDTKVSIMEVDRELSVDPEYSITRDIVNNQLDVKSQDMLIDDPNKIRAIHHDVKNGVFPQVNAIAKKLKALDGGIRSDLDYYIEAANRPEFLGTVNQPPVIPVGSQQGYQESVQQPNQQAPKKPANRSKKKAAGSSSATKAPKKVDVWEDMSDDELMAYREQVLSRM
jgi:hypothetical protein